MSRSHFEAFKGGVDSRMALRCTGAVGRSKDAVSGLSEVGLEVVRLQRRGLGGVLGAIATKSGRKSGGGALPTGLGRSRRGQGHQLRSWRWAALLWFARPGGGEGLAGRVSGGRPRSRRYGSRYGWGRKARPRARSPCTSSSCRPRSCRYNGTGQAPASETAVSNKRSVLESQVPLAFTLTCGQLKVWFDLRRR